MTQAYRGAILLSIAGCLLLLAVVAYLMGDLQSNMSRQRELLRDRKLERDSRAMAAQFRDELATLRAAINDSRRRLDDLSRRVIATHNDLEELKSSRQRSTSLEPWERDQ